MENKLVDLGAIKAMRNVDGSLLPDSFCSQCEHIMIPDPDYNSMLPQLCRYICPACGYEIRKEQADKVREIFKRSHYMR